MGGSGLFTLLSKKMKVTVLSKYVFMVASGSLLIPVLTNNKTLIFGGE